MYLSPLLSPLLEENEQKSCEKKSKSPPSSNSPVLSSIFQMPCNSPATSSLKLIIGEPQYKIREPLSEIFDYFKKKKNHVENVHFLPSLCKLFR